MEEKEKFKPYIPADKITPEFTVTAMIIGLILAVIFGAANAYLGLRVGMTISASIPAAVMSMGVMHVLKRKNILESNMVQTIASAGEAVASGAIFTLPVFFMWEAEGIAQAPSTLTFIIMAMCGSLLGVFFMIPLRNALIVQEHGVLPYPEGTACAEVLLAGERGGSSASIVFIGMGIAAAIKFIVEGLKVVRSVITIPIDLFKTQFSLQASPALFSVGYICGIKISSILFAGSIFGWVVIIPVIVAFGGNNIIDPSVVSINDMYVAGGAEAIWKAYCKYIGAGALAAGGIISLCKSFPMIIRAFATAVKGMKKGSGSVLRTEKDMSMKIVITAVIAIALVLCIVPSVPVGPIGTILVVIAGFFFATVSSRLVGLIGTSNNPISGMIIATLLLSSVIFKFAVVDGSDVTPQMMAAVGTAAIVSFIASIAGDTSQDLKTGYILGATPKYQQLGMIIASIVSAVAVGGMLILLNEAWGFNSTELPAPQASLMKMITEGVMSGDLPWNFVFIGAFIAIFVSILQIPVLPFAMGIFLPQSTVISMMVGGIVSWIVTKVKEKRNDKEAGDNGILFSSGLIAGEGLMGVVLAVLAVLNASGSIDLSGVIDTGYAGNIVVTLLISALIVFYALRRKKEKEVA